MRHENCQDWDYETHPQASAVTDACNLFLTELRANPGCKQLALEDTRAEHIAMFKAVVPLACPHVAGHYRGEDFDCLRAYKVRFGPHEGTLPVAVPMAMEYFHKDLMAGFADLDAAAANLDKPLVGGAFLVRLVQLVASALTRFLTIHPYMNGNGHMGRLLVWAALGRYNMLPVNWWLDDSPPNYGVMLTAYRAGNRLPLERFLLKCIKG